jgi:hypothetical protein
MDQLAQASQGVWKDMVICGVTPGPGANPLYTHACGYPDLIRLIQAVISNLIVLSTLLATIGFIWVGFKLMTAGGDPGALKDAKEMFKKIFIGFFWIIAAWVVVYTITSALLKPEFNRFLINP